MVTKKEFIDYVKSFNKKPGEFTDEEIYEIGYKHKELSKIDKNWEEVCNLVGWLGSAESLRGFIYRKLKKDGKIESPTLLNEENLQAITNEDLFEERQALLKVKQQTRDEWTAYRKLVRDNSRVETFIEEIKNTVRQIPSLPMYKFNGNVDVLNSTEMIMCFSDLHLGSDFTNSYNKYNKDIALNRVNTYVNNVIKYCKQFNIKTLHFLNMGDLISGIIHTTLRLENNLDLVEQIINASEIVANVLCELQKYVPEITYRSVTDNHARAMANKVENAEADNFNRLIDYYVETRLEHTNIKFPHDNLGIEVGKFYLNNGKMVMFSHGHEDKKTSVFQDFVGLTREFPDYIFLAHFHSSSERAFNGCKVFINGSIIGTDTYAYSKRLFNKPTQKLVVFDNNNVIDIDIEL